MSQVTDAIGRTVDKAIVDRRIYTDPSGIRCEVVLNRTLFLNHDLRRYSVVFQISSAELKYSSARKVVRLDFFHGPTISCPFDSLDVPVNALWTNFSCEITAKPSIPAKNISWTLRNKTGALLTPIRMGKSNILWHGTNDHLKAALAIQWSTLGKVPQVIIGEWP